MFRNVMFAMKREMLVNFLSIETPVESFLEPLLHTINPCDFDASNNGPAVLSAAFLQLMVTVDPFVLR